MAKQLCKFPTMMVMFLVLCGAILVQAANDGSGGPTAEGEGKDPWFGHQLPPEPRPNYYNFLKKCIDTLTKKCGLHVYDYIFNARQDLDDGCCKKFIKMGETCSTSLSYTLSHIETFARWRGQIYNKAKAVRDLCLKKL